jgi:hypothetical protein
MLYRLRNNLNYSWFKFATRAIKATPPIPCDPAGTCAIHTMAGTGDLPLYLVAIKSFLHFYPHVAVVVHSDGSLDASAQSALKHHVPGIRIVSIKEADDRAANLLGKDSFLFRSRRGTLEQQISWRRLIDTELWESPKRKILMDSDVITIRRPDEMIDWIEGQGGPFLFGQPRDATQPAPPPDMRLVQNIFKSKIEELSRGMGMPSHFLDGTTSGCYGSSGEMSLPTIEKIIKVCVEVGIPIEQWGCEQCAVIYLLSNSGGERLNPQRYINFDPSCEPRLGEVATVHFYGTHRFYKNLYTNLARRVARVLNAAVPVLA